MTLAHHEHPVRYDNGTGLARQHQQQPALSGPSQQALALSDWAQAAEAAYRVAETLVGTSFVPTAFRGKPYEATAAILSGAEVGLSPMGSLRAFDIIQGAAAPKAIALRAIVQSRGHQVWVDETTDSRAIVCAQRAGSTHIETSEWTIDRARQLQLTGKPNWKNQPKAMLIARATSEVCRLIAADAILGMPYSAEEIADGTQPGDPPPAPAQRDGEPAAEPVRRTARRTPTKTAAKPVAPRTASATDAPVEGPPLPSDNPEPPPDVPEENTPEPPAADDGKPTGPQNRKMHALFREADITERDDRLKLTSIILGHQIDTSAGLTRDQANNIIDHLEQWATDGHLPDHAAAVLHGDNK